jgi:hypothetical protein
MTAIARVTVNSTATIRRSVLPRRARGDSVQDHLGRVSDLIVSDSGSALIRATRFVLCMAGGAESILAAPASASRCRAQIGGWLRGGGGESSPESGRVAACGRAHRRCEYGGPLGAERQRQPLTTRGYRRDSGSAGKRIRTGRLRHRPSLVGRTACCNLEA